MSAPSVASVYTDLTKAAEGGFRKVKANMIHQAIGDSFTEICPAAPDRSCDLGTSRVFEDRSGKVGEVSLVRCRSCGVGLARPPLPDVAFLYDDRHSQDFQPSSIGWSRKIKQIAFRSQARQMLAQVGTIPGRVLDYGCGSGLFTRCLGDLIGPEHVVGTDFHDTPPAELARRRYVPNDRVAEAGGNFDLVIAMHVLEHDDDPVSLLRRIAAEAKPGGRILIEVPNVDCAWAKLLGECWDAWYLPYHRIHFSRCSLRGVIERSGLQVDQEFDVCVPSMGRSLANLLGRRNTLPFLLAGILLHPIQVAVERVTRQPSALRVVISKP